MGKRFQVSESDTRTRLWQIHSIEKATCIFFFRGGRHEGTKRRTSLPWAGTGNKFGRGNHDEFGCVAEVRPAGEEHNLRNRWKARRNQGGQRFDRPRTGKQNLVVALLCLRTEEKQTNELLKPLKVIDLNLSREKRENCDYYYTEMLFL